MLYAVLCYNDEATVMSWSQDQDDAVMANLHKVHDKLYAEKKLGPAIRLLPTTAAATLRKAENIVIDGPYAETKEQLLGFYIMECDDLDGAIAAARDLAKANPGGAYEIRPIRLYTPGLPMPEGEPA